MSFLRFHRMRIIIPNLENFPAECLTVGTGQQSLNAPHLPLYAILIRSTLSQGSTQGIVSLSRQEQKNSLRPLDPLVDTTFTCGLQEYELQDWAVADSLRGRIHLGETNTERLHSHSGRHQCLSRQRENCWAGTIDRYSSPFREGGREPT